MRPMIPLTLASVLLAAPALALDDTDRTAIVAKFDTLLSDIETKNHAGYFDVMPPAVLDSLARRFGMTVDDVKAAMLQQMGPAMQEVAILDVSYDMDAAEIGKTGTGRDYAMVPTRTVVEMDGQRLQATSQTLAVEDGEEWYLMRLETPQHMQILAEVYPDLADLPAPDHDMQIVE